MTSQRYAKTTTVSPEKSRAEIESTLRRYGADQFMYGWQEGRGIIGFRINGVPVRVILPLPSIEDFQYYDRKTAYGITRKKRTQEAAVRAHEQAERQSWRALLLVIKAKLEAIEAGITTFEQEFLANMVLPDNTTVSQTLAPQIWQALTQGRIPSMLPPVP